ncbi:MAG: hypothetical protein H0V82_12390 [Candidatus Protochlamydia sp.]|nr:hypothetical protein [Candidatus Protochlamydia sp.]
MTFNQEDKIISEFLESIGPWRDFVVIGGGFALFIYKLYLSDPKLKNPPIGTRDIDSLIPRKIPEISKKNIQSYLREAGFNHIFKDLGDPATEAYVKVIAGAEVEIEFLTNDSVRNNKDKNIVIAGVVAKPLSYLTLSLQKTLKFQTYSKITGNVVTPGAWIFHKGLTFTKRKSSLKALKDLYGIWYVASQLADFSDNALDEFVILAKQHPKWFKTFQKNLQNWFNNASPSDWSKLEAQDPSGSLRKLIFEQIMKKLFELSGIL